MIYDRIKLLPYAVLLAVLHEVLPKEAYSVVLGGVLVWGVGYILYSWYTDIAKFLNK